MLDYWENVNDVFLVEDLLVPNVKIIFPKKYLYSNLVADSTQ